MFELQLFNLDTRVWYCTMSCDDYKPLVKFMKRYPMARIIEKETLCQK